MTEVSRIELSIKHSVILFVSLLSIFIIFGLWMNYFVVVPRQAAYAHQRTICGQRGGIVLYGGIQNEGEYPNGICVNRSALINTSR